MRNILKRNIYMIASALVFNNSVGSHLRNGISGNRGPIVGRRGPAYQRLGNSGNESHVGKHPVRNAVNLGNTKGSNQGYATNRTSALSTGALHASIFGPRTAPPISQKFASGSRSGVGQSVHKDRAAVLGRSGSLWTQSEEGRLASGGQNLRAASARRGSEQDVRQAFGKGAESPVSGANQPHVDNDFPFFTRFGDVTITSVGGIHGDSTASVAQSGRKIAAPVGRAEQATETGTTSGGKPLSRSTPGRSTQTSQSFHQRRSGNMAQDGNSARFHAGAKIADFGLRATATALTATVGFKNLNARTSTAKAVTEKERPQPTPYVFPTRGRNTGVPAIH